jgi:hypothetical protein
MTISDSKFKKSPEATTVAHKERTQYKLIVWWNMRDFETDVEAMLAQGWQCQGGVAIAYDANDVDGQPVMYSQALIKRPPLTLTDEVDVPSRV